MTTTSFETIARHFAQDKSVDLNFKEKCCPCADLETKKIYLPKAMNEEKLLPTLAALIHESYHIKHSGNPRESANAIYILKNKWFKNNNRNEMKGQFALLFNALEDIRIDHKAFKVYPNARYLYTKLIEFFGNKKAVDDKSDQVQAFIDLIQQVYVYGVFGNTHPEFFHNKELFDKFMNRFGKTVDKVVKSSISAKTYPDLTYSVEDLWKCIAKFLNVKGRNKASAEQIQEKAEESKEEAKSDLKDIREQKEKAEKAYNKEAKKKPEDRDSDTFDELSNELKKLRDKENKKEQEIKEAEEALKKIEDLAGEGSGDDDDIDIGADYDLEDFNDEPCKGDDDELTTKETKELEQLINVDINEDPAGFSINGFGRLNALSKRMKAELVPLFDFESCLQDIFKRLELSKTYTKDTGKVNLAKIHKIFKHEGEVNDIFVEDRLKAKYNNKLIFLIDASGSMGGMNSHKNQIVYQCISNMINMMESHKVDYNLEYAIYTFSDRNKFGKVKDFEEEITSQDDLYYRYNRCRFGGGTDIIEALEKCYGIFEDMGNVKDKRFLICMTDAEIGPSAENTILKEYNARAERMVFIGINRKEYCDAKSRFFTDILMGRMVNSVNDMEAVLVDSFDRLI